MPMVSEDHVLEAR